MLPEWIFNGDRKCVRCATIEQARQLWSAVREFYPDAGPNERGVNYQFDNMGDKLTYNIQVHSSNDIDWYWCDRDYYVNRGYEVIEFSDFLSKDAIVEPVLVEDVCIASLFSEVTANAT